ncbi:MAG TPA: hypothetical protein P5060_03300, partial [Candidatus Absconditabacterales bacterium]|nr:hypothetical protein [Candidatus Absconditabacterales bacterium]
NILVDKEYASIIKGGNNLIVVYISDDQPFISKKIDYFICFDDFSITKNEKVYDLQNIINIKDFSSKYKNVPAFGYSLKILGLDLKEGEKVLEKFFQGDILKSNIELLEQGYTDVISTGVEKSLDLSKKIGDPKTLFHGNEIIAKGAMESGLDRYSAYPMTPASTIIDEVAKDPRVTFFQGEDEIAVSMSMLGAKFAGKRAMCGTSGGGFALMTESISYSNQAEIGGVYVLSQRDGPSTGTPTFTGQGDLDFALHASFGETYPIVLAPSDFETGYNLIGKALNWSDTYQHPVIYITDKQFSESYLSIDQKTLKAAKINRGELAPFIGKGDRGFELKDKEFKRYLDTKSGISPYSIAGTKDGEFIATSYEHDEFGATNEDPEIKKKMIEKRARKLETFIKKEFNKDFYGYEIINPKAKKFFITFGFNKYNLQSVITSETWQSKGYGLIVITVLQPLDTRLKQRLSDNEKNIEELTFVEMNHGGTFQKLITNECSLKSDSREKKIKNIRKYTLYPIFKEEIN